MSYVFVFRAYPDIDHMSPVAWKLLEEGEEVHGVLSTGLRPDGDHRIELLCRSPRFTLHRARPTLPWALLMMRRARASLLAVEWGYGVPAGYAAFPRPAGLWAMARTLGNSVLRAREPTQTRGNFVAAAAVLGVPTVCLPHGMAIHYGLNIGLHPDDEIPPPDRELKDWALRNGFAAYVFNTENARRFALEDRGGDATVMQTWGSARWAPEWFELNRRLAPPFAWPEPAAGRVRAVFMLPRWTRRPDGALEWGSHVRGEKVLELVRRLHTLPELSLAVAAHPRSNSDADPILSDPSVDPRRIHDVTGTNSVSLIAAADIVIDAESSIGIEAVLQDKVVLAPTFIFTLMTLYRVVPDICVLAEDVEQAVAYVRAHAGGSPRRPGPEAREELMRRVVYGDRPVPFDVLGEYSRRIREVRSAAPTAV